MKAFIDGQIIELTKEEIEQLNNMQTLQLITDRDRISALEQAITDLAIQTMGVGIDE